MSGIDGSHLQLQPPANHGNQILRHSPNRHFLPSAAFSTRFLSNSHHQTPPPSPTSDAPKTPLPQTPSPLKQMKKAEDNKAPSIEGANEEGIKEEIKTPAPPCLPGIDDKQRRSRKLKTKRLMSHAPGSDGIPDALASNSCRYDSSLSLLTKKFVDLIQTTEGRTIDLNQAAVRLDVQKRRIYDITNVLEGVGLMEKTLKNHIRWTGDDQSGRLELESQTAELKAENESLLEKECRLDEMIREMEDNVKALTNESDEKRFLYLAKEDIDSLPHFQNSTLIAIKAPHGTSIEVPDPDEVSSCIAQELDFPQTHYRMLVRSCMGPIDCFLISDHEERLEANEDQQPVPMDLSEENQSDDRNDEACAAHHADEGATEMIRPRRDEAAQNISTSGITKIVPDDNEDADYWFETDRNWSLSDIWGTLIQ